MSLAYVGPVRIDFHGNPAFQWNASIDVDGRRAAAVTGVIEWTPLHQLTELLANPHRRISIGPDDGVVEFVWASDQLLRPFNGWWLLRSMQPSPDQHSSVSGLVPFALDAVFLGGHREPLVVRGSRVKTGDLGLLASALLAEPFRGGEASGTRALVDPGGFFFTREYDAAAHDPRSVDGDSRLLGLYAAPTAEVVRLDLPRSARVAYTFVASRGQDVRAWDRREERDVYGPAHPFLVASDLTVTNGLLRFTVGARGLVPYLTVDAFADDGWRSCGHLLLAEPNSGRLLADARLTRLTPDDANVTLLTRGQGEIAVQLRRGERMLRVTHGSPLAPTVSTQRRVRWQGIPPQIDATGLTLEAGGRYGPALRVAAGAVAELAWPPDVPASEWSACFWWTPDAASGSQGDSGLVAVQDLDGTQVGRVRFETAADNIRWTQGANTVASGPLTWTAGQHVFVALAFSETGGMTLTVKAGTNAPVHATNPAAVDPGTADETFRSIMLASNSLDGFSSTPFSSQPFASSLGAGGKIGHARILYGRLTDSEAAALALAATRLADQPTAEGRVAWYAPLDTVPQPGGSPQDTGRIYETTVDGGTTRAPVGDGLTRAFAVTDSTYPKVAGLAIATETDTDGEIAALIATAATLDDVDDQQAQFAAESEQQVRIR